MPSLDRPALINREAMLADIIATEPHSLGAVIAREALEYHGAKDFFNDLLTYGCKSGLITQLIYTYDIHNFFDRHYLEIENIRREIEINIGEKLNFESDLKTQLCWTAFEEIALRLACELGVR